MCSTEEGLPNRVLHVVKALESNHGPSNAILNVVKNDNSHEHAILSLCAPRADRDMEKCGVSLYQPSSAGLTGLAHSMFLFLKIMRMWKPFIIEGHRIHAHIFCVIGKLFFRNMQFIIIHHNVECLST